MQDLIDLKLANPETQDYHRELYAGQNDTLPEDGVALISSETEFLEQTESVLTEFPPDLAHTAHTSAGLIIRQELFGSRREIEFTHPVLGNLHVTIEGELALTDELWILVSEEIEAIASEQAQNNVGSYLSNHTNSNVPTPEEIAEFTAFFEDKVKREKAGRGNSYPLASQLKTFLSEHSKASRALAIALLGIIIGLSAFTKNDTSYAEIVIDSSDESDKDAQTMPTYWQVICNDGTIITITANENEQPITKGQEACDAGGHQGMFQINQVDQPAAQVSFGAPQETQTNVAGSFTVTVTASVLNLRAGPGTNYDVVGNVSQGQTLQVVAQQGPWCQLTTGTWVITGPGYATVTSNTVPGQVPMTSTETLTGTTFRIYPWNGNLNLPYDGNVYYQSGWFGYGYALFGHDNNANCQETRWGATITNANVGDVICVDDGSGPKCGVVIAKGRALEEHDGTIARTVYDEAALYRDPGNAFAKTSDSTSMCTPSGYDWWVVIDFEQ